MPQSFEYEHLRVAERAVDLFLDDLSDPSKGKPDISPLIEAFRQSGLILNSEVPRADQRGEGKPNAYVTVGVSQEFRDNEAAAYSAFYDAVHNLVRDESCDIKRSHFPKLLGDVTL